MQSNCSAETAVSVLADGMAARHLSASEKNSTLYTEISGFRAVYACCVMLVLVAFLGLGSVWGIAYTSPTQKGRNKEARAEISSSLYEILDKEVSVK
jgi:hypothetical protein